MIVLAGCTATINQSSFFPSANLKPPDTKLIAPPGYSLIDRPIELPQLGRVRAVFLDNPDSDVAIVYSAGNGGFVDSDRWTQVAARLAMLTGADIIMYDYPGRGGTTMPATVAAAIASGPLLVEQFMAMGWMGKNLGYAYGFSFGGSMAAAMARSAGFTDLILQGTAADYEQIGRNFVPGIAKPFVTIKVAPELLPFDYLGYVVQAKVPVLLLSGIDDDTIKPKRMRSFGEQLSVRGATVTFHSVPGKHGEALNSVEGQQAISAFVIPR